MRTSVLGYLLTAACANALNAIPQLLDTLQPQLDAKMKAGDACNKLRSSVTVLSPLHPEYIQDTKHYASNAADVPVCVVEPDTPQQVSKILKVVAEYNAPFAVMSGGHAINPGFSSTPGVHISMSRFNSVTLSADGQTADIGPGQTWGDVYRKLEGTGRIVVGGRVASVGVGGFLAYGGGYSFHSSQYGLGVDNIQEYTLVFPNGTITNVSSQSNTKLFNALKGSGNNFGVITSFKLKTIPCPPKVWGGYKMYSQDKFPRLLPAIAAFSANNTDPKASILPSFLSLLTQGLPLLSIQMFYDGPSPPPGIFDAFLQEPTTDLSKDSEFGSRSFVDFIEATPAGLLGGLRTLFNAVPTTQYTLKGVQAAANVGMEWGTDQIGLLRSGVLLTVTVEPFSPGAFAHASGQEAYPHDSEYTCFPTNLSVSWLNPLDDGYWKDTILSIAQKITKAAVEEGQDLSKCPSYPNYALSTTPLEKMYLDRLPALQAYRAQIDPHNIMKLAGGFKL